MSDLDYSFDGRQGFSSPLFTVTSSVTHSGWDSRMLRSAPDTQEDVVVNAASKSHSRTGFYDFMPDGNTKQTENTATFAVSLSSLPPTPLANSTTPSSFERTAKPGSQGGGVGANRSSRSSGRAADSSRNKSSLRVSDDALKPTNNTDAVATPKVNLYEREPSTDRYDLGPTLHTPTHHAEKEWSTGSDRLPALTGTLKSVDAPSRGSSATLVPAMVAGRTDTAVQRDRTSAGGSGAVLPAVPQLSSSRRGSGSGPSSNTSTAAAATASRHTSGKQYWHGSDNSSTTTPSTLSSFQGVDGRETRRDSQGQSAAEKKASGDSRGHRGNGAASSPTFSNAQATTTSTRPHNSPTNSGVRRSREDPLHTSFPTPTTSPRPSANTVKSVTVLSPAARTQSDGDLRLRSSSRNSDRGGSPSTLNSSPSRSSSIRRRRAASEPTPLTDEETAYFPYGLMEMPPGEQSRSREQMKESGGTGGGVTAGSSTSAAAGSSVPSSVSPASRRFKTFATRLSERHVALTAATSTTADTADVDSSVSREASPLSRRPYDLSFATGFDDSSDDDDSEDYFGYDGVKTSSVYAYPPHRGNTVNTAAAAPASFSSSPATSPSSSQQQTHGHRTSARLGQQQSTTSRGTDERKAVGNTAALSGFTPLAATPTSLSPQPHPSASKLDRKPSNSEPVAMLTSAASGKGRHYTFDGDKGHHNGHRSSDGRGGCSAAEASAAKGTSADLSQVVSNTTTLDGSTSLSCSLSTRAPRPPSRRAVNRDAVEGAIVAVQAQTAAVDTTQELDEEMSRGSISPKANNAAFRRSSESRSARNRVSSAQQASSGGEKGAAALPSVAPATRRKPGRPSAIKKKAPLMSAAPSSSRNSRNDTAQASTSPAQPAPLPVHKRYIKTPTSAVGVSGGGTAGQDAPLSPIQSDGDTSIHSADGAVQTGLMRRTLRQLNSSVRIRTTVDEEEDDEAALLLKGKDEPWPLRPPPPGIMVRHRVFDPAHPRLRGPRLRELPDGQRQANWQAPETHYTTTLADLAAYGDEEDEEEAAEAAMEQGGERERLAHASAAAAAAAAALDDRMHVLQDFQDSLWDSEDVNVDVATPITTPSPPRRLDVKAAPPALPPPSLKSPSSSASARSVPISVLLDAPTGSHSSSSRKRSTDGVAAGGPARPPSVHSGKSTPTPASHHGSAQALATPHLVTALPVLPLHPSPPEASQLRVNDSLNHSFNPQSKRYGGIVVDEVEKVRRMREESVFTPIVDDLYPEGTRDTPASSSVTTSTTARGKSPQLGPRIAALRPLWASSRDLQNYNSASNRGTSTSGVQESFSDNNRNFSHSAHNETLLLDAQGHTVLPLSPGAAPTFARIIAQRSGGHHRTSVSGAASALSRSGSRDSFFDELDAMIGFTASFEGRKSMVTFPSPYPDGMERPKKASR